jgi:hypothetical protein
VLSAIRCLVLLWFATAIAAPGLAIRGSQAPERKPQFALEVDSGDEGFAPIHMLVERDAGQEVRLFPPRVHLAGEDAGAGGQQKACAVKIAVKDEGNAVSLEASVYFGTCDTEDPNTAYNRISERSSREAGQAIGKYTLGLDQSVILEVLRPFGLQPYTIKVVSAQVPRGVDPATVSKVPSLQIAIVGKDRAFYTLLIHNLSSKEVTGFVVTRPLPGGGSSGNAEFAGANPLIVRGGSRELKISSDEVTCESPDKADSVPCPIVLEGALFADGTHGGDPSAAAEVEAQYLENKQSGQVRELVRRTLADSSLPDTAKIALLRSEIPNLAEEPDEAVIDQMRSRYPDVPDATWETIRESMRASVGNEKQRLLQGLRDFEEAASSESLAEWLHDGGMIR